MSQDLATKTLGIKRLQPLHSAILSDLVSDAKQATTDEFIISKVALISTLNSTALFNSSTITTESNSTPRNFTYLSDILDSKKLAKSHSLDLGSSSPQRIDQIQQLMKTEK